MEHWTLHPKDTDHFWHSREMSITEALHQINGQLVTLANTMGALCHWAQDVDEAVMKFTDDEVCAKRLKATQLIALEKCTDKLFLSTCDVDVEVSKFQAGVKAMKASLAMKKILAMKTIKVKGRNRKYQKFKLSKLAKMRTRSQRRQEMAADEENAGQEEAAETGPNVGRGCQWAWWRPETGPPVAIVVREVRPLRGAAPKKGAATRRGCYEARLLRG